MRLIYKICLANFLIALLITWIVMLGMEGESFYDFRLIFGVISIVGGVTDLFASLIFYLFRRYQWSKGYLLTAAVLIVLGIISCVPLLV